MIYFNVFKVYFNISIIRQLFLIIAIPASVKWYLMWFSFAFEGKGSYVYGFKAFRTWRCSCGTGPPPPLGHGSRDSAIPSVHEPFQFLSAVTPTVLHSASSAFLTFPLTYAFWLSPQITLIYL